jgi:hypothetical protein
VPSLVKIGPVVRSGEEVKNVKVYGKTDSKRDDDQNSSLELSAQVS